MTNNNAKRSGVPSPSGWHPRTTRSSIPNEEQQWGTGTRGRRLARCGNPPRADDRGNSPLFVLSPITKAFATTGDDEELEVAMGHGTTHDASRSYAAPPRRMIEFFETTIDRFVVATLAKSSRNSDDATTSDNRAG